jgi:hypothetical protein
MLAGDIVMFNDVVAGTGTHPNATTYATSGVASGLLRNIETGANTSITLTASQQGVAYANNGAAPPAGSDAANIFNGYVDLSTGTGTSIELDPGEFYTNTFSGLEPGNEYEVVATTIRGNPLYFNRWTLVTLEGAESFEAAHSSGTGVVTQGLAANQVALWTGYNSAAGQGFVAQWTHIDPGADGEFAIVSEQYQGPTPGVGTGTSVGGPKGYGVTAVRLIEHDLAFSVSSSVPADGEVVATAPNTVTLEDRLTRTICGLTGYQLQES